ncbi:hypothetical protein ASG40_03665 [Methylobacterium sp. Leaf399]|uniref:GDSL-type esterase/lipase family protein n=1 Tax=unclassified Methylobacterium TaxID=2615210 RepID=UPI0006F51AB7|nr:MULTISPECIES: GDSL-type esterase/lipase family protein [unclassified Methylobacterium]KQP61767.1 hypothetical protein ASF39_03645 [Methylobacterium sp. Leaf108]KQT19910.1 hypothetical protein ASG40_03665 [Methylobacterium sp. Leaf399]
MIRAIHVGALVALCLLSPAQAQDAACDEADIAVATIPVPPQSATAYRRARAVGVTVGEAQDGDVVLLGDSLTQLWPAASVAETFGAKVLNLGVGSDRTQNVLWRLQDARYATLSPRTVFLMIGTNNLGYLDKVCAIREGVRQIVERIDALWRKPRLVVVGILPRGKKSAFRDADRIGFNRELENLLTRRGNAVMVDDTALRCADDHCPTFAPDMVHLTPEGYAVLGAAVRLRLEAAGAP